MDQKNKIEPVEAGEPEHANGFDADTPGNGEAESTTWDEPASDSADAAPPGPIDKSAQDSNEALEQETELPSIDVLSREETTAPTENAETHEADRIRASELLTIAARQPSESGGDHGDDNRASSIPAGAKSINLAEMAPGTEFPDDTIESPPAAVPDRVGDNSDETDLLDVVRRQWWLIGAIIAAAMIAGAVILSQLTPLYTATAEIIIDPQRPTLPALEAILPGMGTDEQSIETEAVVLTSGVLLDSVIDRLDLINDSEFNSALESAEGVTSKDRSRALTKIALLSRLEVVPVGDSRVISILATSESGDKAARIANTVIDEYLQSRRTAKFDASSETSTWIEQRIAELQTELRESEERAAQFRSDAELLEAGGATLISQQLVDLNGQVISARAATAAARAELSQVSGLINSSDTNSVLASAGVLQSPLVQELRKQQVALERQIAELSSELGPAHPRMIQLNADAADLKSQISIEVDKVIQGLRNAAQVAEAREAELERQAVTLTARLSLAKEDEIQLRALEREVEANRQLLETLLARRKELGSPDQAQTSQPGARVISMAAAPIVPSFPRIGISMAGILMVSTIIGLVAAFIREIRRQGISTLEQLEAVTKLSALGFVPHVSSRRQRREMLASIVTKPRLPFAQAMKTLNWQLEESMPEEAKVIVVTSSIPGEGKTTTAIGIARIKALKGHKTIVIDADIRNPSIHERLNGEHAYGLRDIIEGTCKLADAISSDEETSLKILQAGQPSSDALALIESPAMSSILKVIRDQYDFVVVDSPPIATAPDACVLSREADATIFAVRWSQTPVNAVKYGLRVLKRNGGHITGTVMTMVEASRSLNRNYGYFGYYGYYGPKAQE